MAASILIRNAKLVQLGHQHHNQSIDVFILDGKIKKIGKELEIQCDTVIEDSGLYISSGWVDLRCHLTDPGMEHRDTLKSLQDTAAAGGFSKVVTLPNSEPPIADKSMVHYVVNSAKNHVVQILPTAQIAEPGSNDNLTELYDMHLAGARAFTAGDEAISNGLLKKALLYTKPFNGKVFTHPSDKSLENGGVVNESNVTLHTGLKTSPAIAEYLNIKEQIEIARYCDSEIHFSCVSTKESVDLIKSAKDEGIKVTCDVALFNLCFTDEKVLGFDENFKVYPPLRSESDRQALIEGLNSGVIDAICSNHNPQSLEGKVMEFNYAAYGALSLQLMLPWYIEYLKDEVSLERFISGLTSAPNQIIGDSEIGLEEEKEADLTVFSLEKQWSFDSKSNASASRNSHEWNKQLKGKVVALFSKHKFRLNN